MISRKRSQTLVQRSSEPTCVSRSSPILKIPKNPANPASDNPPNTRKHTQTLMISRKRSQTLVQRSSEPTCVSRSSPILKIPINPANPAPDNPPNTRKHTQTLMISRKRSQTLVQRSSEPTCVSRSSPILKIPKNPANPASDNPPNTRKHTQTLMISRKRSQTLVQRSSEPTCVSRSSPILKIPKNPANPASDNPPNTRKHTQTLMISRKRSQTLVQRSSERTCVSRSSPILKIPINPANPAPDNPPNTRKHTQTLMISRKRSQTLVQRSSEPTCVSRSSPILKIPKNPANPASDNPPNTRKHTQTLMISRKRSQTLVQRSSEPTCVSRSSPILKIPINPANPAPDNPPNTRKHTQTLMISRKRSQTLVQRSSEPTCVSRSSPILKIQKILQILLQTTCKRVHPELLSPCNLLLPPPQKEHAQHPATERPPS